MKNLYSTILLGALLALFTNNMLAQPCLYFEYPDSIRAVYDIYETQAGEMWLATSQGAYKRTASGSYTHFMVDTAVGTTSTPVELYKIKALQGRLYFLSDNGAHYQQNGVWRKYHAGNGLPANKVFDMVLANNGTLWFATSAGIAILSGSNFTTVTPFNNNIIVGLGKWSNRIYASNASSTEPDKYFNGSTWTSLPNNNFLGGNKTSKFIFDLQGNLFTQSYFSGNTVSKLRNNTWTEVRRTNKGAQLFNDTLYILANRLLIKLNGTVLDTVNDRCVSGSFISSVFVPAAEPSYFLSLTEVGSEKRIVKFKAFDPQLAGSINNSILSAAVSSNGALFKDVTKTGSFSNQSFAQFSLNASPNKSLIFASNLWLAGTAQGQIKSSINTYGIDDDQFLSGPASTNYNTQYINKYDRVWKVTRAQINEHILKFNNPAYQLPEAIKSWPGNGDTQNGEAQILAPFFDVNNNTIYEPMQGDYPIIKGDEAVYFIANDSRKDRSIAEGSALGVEVHGMMYLFDTIDADIANTVFVDYKIYNRSGADLTNVIPGIWTDFDLGYTLDDNFLSDTTSNCVLVFNADNEDDQPFGFGTNIPSAGVSLPGKQFTGSMFYNARNFGTTGVPQTPNHVYNFMQQKWKDGSPLVLELPNGDGYSTGTQFPPTNFQYLSSVGWFAGVNASELNNVSTGTTIPILADDASFCFSLAYSSAFGDNSDLFASASALLNRFLSVDTFHTNSLNKCLENTIGLMEPPISTQVQVYPNPTTGLIYVKLAATQTVEKLELYHINGQKLLHSKNQATIDVSKLPAGIYILQVSNNQGLTVSQRVVKH